MHAGRYMRHTIHRQAVKGFIASRFRGYATLVTTFEGSGHRAFMVKVHPKDKRTIWDKYWRMRHLYKIRTEGRGLVLFDIDARPAQRALFERAKAKNFRGIREINLKARKEGVTTFWALFYLDDTLFTPNTTTEIMAHRDKDVKKIFKIVKTAYTHMPPSIQLADGRVWYKPKANYDNVNELVFDGINSKISVSLESRGETINNLHISEVHHIPENKAAERIGATLEAVPNVELGSNVTMETTANGMGGYFYDLWMDSVEGLTPFTPVFIPWYEKPGNKLTTPKDWQPNEATLEMANRAKEYGGVTLTRQQMFWWETKNSVLKGLMNQEHPTVPDDAFLSSALHVFDLIKLAKVKPRKVSHETKGWKLFEEPKEGRRYVIGADPSEGVSGDNSAASIIDAVTLQEVGFFYSKVTKPPEFAKALAFAGKLFNNALIAVERNNHGHTVLDRLKDIYSNVFMMFKTEERRKKRTKKLGWETNRKTRPLILDNLEELVDEGLFEPSSAILKKEMMNFITDDTGKRQAKVGKHDDLLMATAIAIKVAMMPQKSFGVFEINA